jgi:KDO2-lipid IV(A) lauroyltransferase
VTWLLLNPRNWPTALGCLLLWLCVRVLPISYLQGIGRGMGRAAGRLQAQRRVVAQHNLEGCFPELPDDERRRLLDANLESVGIGLMETGLALWGDRASLLAHIDVQGQEHLEQARAAGNGVLVLMAHYTMVELACRVANEISDPRIFLLGRRNNQPLLDLLINRARLRHAQGTLEKKDLKGLLRALKRNQAVFYAPDQDFNYNSVFAPFFGIPASTVTATADIARRSGALVVPLWCRRSDQGRYQLHFEAAWEDFPGDDQIADASRINRWIQDHVRSAPEQYLWVHRRFKTRPPGDPPFYPERARRSKDRAK